MTTKACDFVVTTGQELGSGLAHGLGPDSLVRLQLRWRPGRPTLKAALGLAGLLPGRLHIQRVCPEGPHSADLSVGLFADPQDVAASPGRSGPAETAKRKPQCPPSMAQLWRSLPVTSARSCRLHGSLPVRVIGDYLGMQVPGGKNHWGLSWRHVYLYVENV